MNYGLITETDAKTIEKTLDLICQNFPDAIIATLELGVRDGRTSRGIHEYLTGKGKLNFHTGIDNGKDMPVEVPFDGCNLILGSSIEVFNEIPDNSQHFLFLDANHSLFFTTADFLLYRNKVKVGGFFAFHDTSPTIKPFTDFQGIGESGLTHNYICCREAVSNLGLLANKFPGWELVFDEYDPIPHVGGVVVIKRIL